MPLLMLLLLIDGAFVLLHVVRILAPLYGEDYSGLLADPRLSLETDRGYGEWFGYGKALAASAVLLVLHRWSRGPAYLAWALVFVAVMVDDAFTVHERGGAAFVALLGLRPAMGLRAQDYGELVVWGILAVLLLAALVLAYRRSTRKVRHHSRRLFILLLALVFFGMVVDMGHMLVSGWVGHIVGVIEDGGELVMLSVVLYAVVEMARQLRKAGATSRPDQPGRVALPAG